MWLWLWNMHINCDIFHVFQLNLVRRNFFLAVNSLKSSELNDSYCTMDCSLHDMNCNSSKTYWAGTQTFSSPKLYSLAMKMLVASYLSNCPKSIDHSKSNFPKCSNWWTNVISLKNRTINDTVILMRTSPTMKMRFNLRTIHFRCFREYCQVTYYFLHFDLPINRCWSHPKAQWEQSISDVIYLNNIDPSPICYIHLRTKRCLTLICDFDYFVFVGTKWCGTGM